MDLRLIEIFCRVYEERGFSKAGKALYLTQSTVSAHIKTLERTVGASLFDRLGRDVQPTKAGALLYQHGRRILEAKAVLIEDMKRFLGGLQGRLELGASTIPGEYLLARLIAGFRQEYPAIDVSLQIDHSRGILDRVAEGTVALGFVGGRVESSTLSFEPFAVDRLVLVAPNRQPWSEIHEIDLEGLCAIPFLQREAGSATRRVLEERLHCAGIAPRDLNVVAELGSTSAIKQGIRSGLGLSILSEIAVQTEIEADLLRTIRIREMPEMERQFYAVLDTRRARSPLGEAFRAFLALQVPPTSSAMPQGRPGAPFREASTQN